MYAGSICVAQRHCSYSMRLVALYKCYAFFAFFAFAFREIRGIEGNVLHHLYLFSLLLSSSQMWEILNE